MNKLFIAIVLTTLLSGCHQSVNAYDIYRATKMCGGIDNVVEIHATFIGTENVYCKSGFDGNLDSYKEN